MLCCVLEFVQTGDFLLTLIFIKTDSGKRKEKEEVEKERGEE